MPDITYCIDRKNLKGQGERRILSIADHNEDHGWVRDKAGQDGAVVFVKETDNITEIEEEVAFSALYQLDLGASAAQTVPLVYTLPDGTQKVIGMASIALPKFLEYNKLFDAKARNKYKENNQLYSMLREIVFFEKGFLSNTPKQFKIVDGLAPILMSSWLYAEDDLHRRNFGLCYDEQTRSFFWARLDFGLSFATITNGDGRTLRWNRHAYHKLTRSDLADFPILQEAEPFYWPTCRTVLNNELNIRGGLKGNKYTSTDEHLFKRLKDNEKFIKEKQQFLLRQFLTPISDKTNIIKEKIKNESRAERLAHTIESRMFHLQWLALSDERFRKFVVDFDDAELVEDSELDKLFDAIYNDRQTVTANCINKTEGKTIFKQKLFERFQALKKQVKNINQGIDNNSPSTGRQTNGVSRLAVDISDDNEKIFYQQMFMFFAVEDEKRSLSKITEEKYQESIQSLVTAFLAKNNKNIDKALTIIQKANVASSVLQPIHQCLATLQKKQQGGEREAVNFFKLLMDKVLIPYLQVKEFTGSDELYQDPVIISVRNITRILETVDCKNNYLALCNGLNCEDPASLKDDLRDIEKNLVKKIVQDKLTAFDTEINRLKKNEPERKEKEGKVNIKIKLLFETIQNGMQVLQQGAGRKIEAFYKYTEKNPVPVTKAMQLSVLKNIDTLSVMISELAERNILDNVQDKNRTEELNYLIQKAHEKIKAIQNTKMTSSKKIKQIVFHIAKLRLNMERVYACERFATGENNKDKKTFEYWIEASRELSHAMGNPNYYDSLSLMDIAQAGMLGAHVLARPNDTNAISCFLHAEHLAKSRHMRTRTKVATSLCVFSGIALVGSIALLVLPLTLPALVVGAMVVVNVVSLLSFVLTLTYSVQRHLRDKDTVQRKLEDMSMKSKNQCVVDSRSNTSNKVNAAVSDSVDETTPLLGSQI